MNLHEYQSKRLFADYGIPVPRGIPVKVAGGAKVLDGSDNLDKVFTADLDVFQGGSGGGVFSKRDTGKILLIGILERGKIDFQFDGSCCTVCQFQPYHLLSAYTQIRRHRN